MVMVLRCIEKKEFNRDCGAQTSRAFCFVGGKLAGPQKNEMITIKRRIWYKVGVQGERSQLH